MLERVTNWARVELANIKEFHNHNRFFPPNARVTTGLLTKPGESVSLYERSIRIAPPYLLLSLRHRRKKGSSEKDRQKLIEAGLRSLSGTYSFQLGDDHGVQLKITIENDEITQYLRAHTNAIIVFLSFDDGKKIRYKDGLVMQTQGDRKNSISFDFPNVSDIPNRDYTRLSIFAKPSKGEKPHRYILTLK